MDGKTLFDRIFASGWLRRSSGRAFAPAGGGALWCRLQHGDRLGEAVPRDRQRGARPDGRPQAEEDYRAHGATGCCSGAGTGLHPARAGGRTRRARPAGRLPLGVGVRPRREAQSQKKTLIASEQDRPDVARRRAQWTTYQGRIDPARLVFIDETWTKTNMAPLRGWAPRGQRLKAKVPHGHWKTMTFLAALRHDRVDAPWLIDGPINGDSFRLYVEQGSRADAPARRHRRHGQSRLAQGQGRAPRHPRRRRKALLPAEILARPEPDRDSSSPSSSTGCERPQGEPSTPSATPSARSSTPSLQPNAQTTSPTQDMTEPKLIPL